MWLCEDKLKRKTSHFRLLSSSQKRRLLKLSRNDIMTAILVLLKHSETGACVEGIEFHFHGDISFCLSKSHYGGWSRE